MYTQSGPNRCFGYLVSLTVLCVIVCMITHVVAAEDGDDVPAREFVPQRSLSSLYDSIEPGLRGRSTVKYFKSDRSVTVGNLKELARRSTDIIVGRPLTNRSYLNEQGNDIYSMYLIQVQTVFKGDVVNGSLMEIKMPGGGWRFSDGTKVAKFASDARPLREGASYIIFMTKRLGKKTHWLPAAGIQSLFEIDSDTDSVIPCDLVETDPVVKKYKNASVGEFLDEILSAVSSESQRNGRM